MPDTRSVHFEGEAEPRRVTITHWVMKAPSGLSLPGLSQMREPDWARILPGYIVTAVFGGYHARRRL
jgi:hypothetical protein